MVLLETKSYLQRSSDMETSFNPLVPAPGRSLAAAVQLIIL